MLKNRKNSRSYSKKIEKVKEVLKTEKIREQIAINELMNIHNDDKSHKQRVLNYLKSIKSNILKLNNLLDNLSVQENIPKLSISKLAKQEYKLRNFL